MKVFTEGVFSAILKMIGGGKFRKEMRKIEKMTADDPDFQAGLDSMVKTNADMVAHMKVYCKRNPNSDLCDWEKMKKYSTMTSK